MATRTPAGSIGVARPTRRAWYVIERNALVYRRAPVVLFSGFFEPVFYLLSMTVGVGALVGDVTLPDGTSVPYPAYVAPALLAASAMNGAFYESTYQLFLKLLEGKTYRGMLATPVTVADMAAGEIGWSMVRGGLYAAGFLTMAVAAADVRSRWALAAFPAALLICAAFAAAGQTLTTTFRSLADFDRVQLVALPLFLCSATFFPLSAYPRWAEVVVAATPLYQGVALERALFLGDVHPGLLGHVAYLVAMTGVFGVVASRRIHRRMLA
ncbi:MAG TPA: ABC transporter permease [Acidimicrobiales bacterium]